MIWVLIIVVLVLIAGGVRKVAEGESARILRLGRLRGRRAAGPGIVILVPFLDRLECVPVEPLSVSLPPQSAITKDEIPIQLQASLDARVVDRDLAVTSVRDWRVYLMSQLQDLMKERLEDLDFDDLDSAFPAWVASIRTDLEEKAASIGTEVNDLKISNLSPRTRPG